jgi:hypothetical protein
MSTGSGSVTLTRATDAPWRQRVAAATGRRHGRNASAIVRVTGVLFLNRQCVYIKTEVENVVTRQREQREGSRSSSLKPT